MREDDLPDVIRHAHDDDTFRALLSSFSDKVIRDFVTHVANTLKVPASIWLSNGDGAMLHVLPDDGPGVASDFCRSAAAAALPSCSDSDEAAIQEFLRRVALQPPGVEKDYTVHKCSLGISSLVFPLDLNGELLGAFVAGKFRHSTDDVRMIQSRITDAAATTDIEGVRHHSNPLLESLLRHVTTIPLLTDEEAVDLGEKIAHLLPLIKSFCATHSARSAHIQSLLFLDDLEKSFTEVVTSETQLSRAAVDYLNKTLERFGLRSALVLSSARDSSVALRVIIRFPQLSDITDDLLLQSPDDFFWLAAHNGGVLLPRQGDGPLSWITEEQLSRLFSSTSAILYSRRLYDGKLLLIGFGFSRGTTLSDFDRLLLKQSASRLLHLLNNALASIETDNLMSETGHMLRRATAKIHSGIAEIQNLDSLSNVDETPEQKEARELAFPAIASGLFKLDLIQRNFEAFRNLREATLHPGLPPQDGIERVDVLAVLNETLKAFGPELRIGGKRFEYTSSVRRWHLNTHRDLFQLLLLNLLDNAEKFSYRDTYIKVSVRTDAKHYVMAISNLGIGFAPEEATLLFTRHYQSIYTSPSRKRVGTGVGLAFC